MTNLNDAARSDTAPAERAAEHPPAGAGVSSQGRPQGQRRFGHRQVLRLRQGAMMRRSRSTLLALALAWQTSFLQAQPPDYRELTAFIKSGQAAQLRQALSTKTRRDINVGGRAALMRIAIAEGKADAVAVLLEWGIDANHVLPGGQGPDSCSAPSPLLYAIGTGAGLPVVKTLVRGGAKPALRVEGQHPLDLAVSLGQQDVAAYLREAGATHHGMDNTVGHHASLLHPALRRAALKADNRALQAWLTPAAFAGMQEPARAELMAALVATGNVDGLTAAIRAGLDPNLVLPIEVQGTTVHVTALNLALGAPVDDAVALCLVALGADVAAKSVDDDAPLLTAIAVGRHALVEPLLAHGADPDVGDTLVAATPLMVLLATERDPVRAVELGRKLLAWGGHVNARSSTGHTPLMMAARAGNAAAVRWLLDAGADRHATTQAGDTALGLAAMRGHDEVIRLLSPPQ